VIATIKRLPEPRRPRVLYLVDGVERTLAEWAESSGISKTTLFHRVVTSGMSMADALAVGKGTRGKRLASPAPCVAFDSGDCRTGAADGSEKVDASDALDTARVRHLRANPPKTSGNSVPRDGIEPPTRGFSIPCSTN
jgi:hypothetical protein